LFAKISLFQNLKCHIRGRGGQKSTKKCHILFEWPLRHKSTSNGRDVNSLKYEYHHLWAQLPFLKSSFPMHCKRWHLVVLPLATWMHMSNRESLATSGRQGWFGETKPEQNKESWNKLCYLSIYYLLNSSVNFINALRGAFAPVDPKSVKRLWQLDWILTLLGATGVKAVHKYVGEIEP